MRCQEMMNNFLTSDRVRTAVTGLGLVLLTVAVARSFTGSPSAGCSTGGCPVSAMLSSFDSQPAFQTVANETGGGSKRRQAAPPWQLKDVDGKTVKLSDFKGKVVILDFWATWCPPCRKEIPGFVALQKKYADKGVTVVGVSLDEGGVGIVKAFMKQNGMNYPVVLGDQQIAMAYGGISSIPTTFVIDKEGNVAAVHEGYSDPSEFEADLNKLL